jgi:hypothetical protein
VIVPVSFSLKRVDAPEEFSVDRVLADVVSTPDWKVDVEVAVYDTEAQRSYGFRGRVVRRPEENSPLDSMGTLYESRGNYLPTFGSREYLLELRDEVDRLLEET